MDTKNLIPYVLHFQQVKGSHFLELDPSHRSGRGTNATRFYFGKGIHHVSVQLVWTGKDVVNLQVSDSQRILNVASVKGSAASEVEPYVSDWVEIPMTTLGGGASIRLELDQAADISNPYIDARATIKVVPTPGYDEVHGEN